MKDILIYTAGLFDGEGCITLCVRGQGEYRSPEVNLVNTSQEIISFLKDNFGGQVISKKKYQDHHMDAWIWKLSHNAAINFIELILPFLKHPQKIYRGSLIINEYKNITKRNGKYSDKEKQDKLDFEYRFFHPSIA